MFNQDNFHKRPFEQYKDPFKYKPWEDRFKYKPWEEPLKYHHPTTPVDYFNTKGMIICSDGRVTGVLVN